MTTAVAVFDLILGMMALSASVTLFLRYLFVEDRPRFDQSVDFWVALWLAFVVCGRTIAGLWS